MALSEARSPHGRTFLFRQIFSCSAVILNFFLHGIYIGSSTVIVAQMRKEANLTDAVTPETASWLCKAHSFDDKHYSIGDYINYKNTWIKVYSNLTVDNNEKMKSNCDSFIIFLKEYSPNFWLCFLASTSSYSAIPWSIILPLLTYRYGRKKLLVLVSLNVLVGNIVFYFSTNMTELIISQAIQGILLASATTITIMIMSEYTSPKYRGVLLTAKSATLFWGVWVSNAIGTYFHWRVISIFVFICSIYYISVLFCCESPYWLAMKGRFDECAKIHRWLKGTDKDSEEELRKLILTQKEHLNNKANTSVKVFFKFFYVIRFRFFYKSIVYSLLLFCLYVFSGKLAYTVYAIDLIKEITSSEKMAYQGMLILDGVTVAGMYLGSILTKYVTRRKQLITFTSIAAVFLYVLSGYIYLVNLNIILQDNYVSLFLLSGFSISISCGPMIMSNCLISEFSPLRYRSYFACCISFLNSILFATTLKLAPLIFKTFNVHGAFLFFAIIVTVFTFLIYFYLPETKDKTILEIQDCILGDNAYIGTELLPLTR